MERGVIVTLSPSPPPGPPPLTTSRMRGGLALTQNLVQLHDGRVGANAVDGLGLLGDVALLEDILIVADWLGRHSASIAARSVGRSGYTL